MADIEVFMQRVRRKVPKADEYSIMDAIVDNARVFCKQSWYLRRALTFLTAVPAAPANVSALAGNGQVTVQWDPVPNALSYTVNVGTVSGRESPSLTMLGTSVGVVLSLTNTTPYFFTVQAVNGVGASTPSDEVTATPLSTNSNIVVAGVPLVSQYMQDMGLSGDEEIIGVKAGQCGTWPLAPGTPRDYHPKWGPGRPRNFAFTPNGHALLYPPPDNAYQILFKVAVQPKLGAMQLADELATNYLEGIAYGAMRELFSTPPWKDPGEAAQYQALFDAEVQRAKREALADFQSGNLRVQPAPFIIRSIN